jgi:hypothetical protein
MHRYVLLLPLLLVGCATGGSRATPPGLERISCTRTEASTSTLPIGRVLEADSLVAYIGGDRVVQIDASFIGRQTEHVTRYFFRGERLICVEDEYVGAQGPASPRSGPSRDVYVSVDDSDAPAGAQKVDLDEKFGAEALMYMDLVRKAQRGDLLETPQKE